MQAITPYNWKFDPVSLMPYTGMVDFPKQWIVWRRLENNCTYRILLFSINHMHEPPYRGGGPATRAGASENLVLFKRGVKIRNTGRRSLMEEMCGLA